MSDIEELKKIADILSEHAQSLLKQDRVLYPVLFSFPTLKNRPVPVSVKLKTVADKEMLSVLMTVVARVSQGMVFITDAYARTPGPDEDPNTVLGEVKDHPDAIESIIVVAYVKGATSLKQIIYVSEKGEYSFTDMGWHDAAEMSGRFGSPYPSHPSR